ncbi:MAG TPA: aminoglycoside phosphotransferase, partial [Aquabacterium sp.]|nr:aminoglycoside phosphotransferase [Aquabacterium sp.]
MSQTPVSTHDASSSSPLQAFGVPWSDPVRLAAFQSWLNTVSEAHGLRLDSIRAASADASFRRYLRAETASGGSLI